jgi:hypothetical protein
VALVGFIGFVECDACKVFTHITEPKNLTIWYHPDDPEILSEVRCPSCGHIQPSRIQYDDFSNFRKRGCSIRSFGEKFEPLTEEAIDEWDIDAELRTLI